MGETLMKRDDKRQLRKLKRDVKQAGNKKRRQKLKRDLRDNPEEAHLSEPSVGSMSSETLNGLDQDATRRRKQSAEEE
jgi:hypothetical protein